MTEYKMQNTVLRSVAIFDCRLYSCFYFLFVI